MRFEDEIQSLALILAQLKKSDSAKPFYDLMSGAFVWDDERVHGLTVAQQGCLRGIFRFRSSIIGQEADHRFEALWELLRQACPEWIGFSPERCLPNEQLAEKYLAAKRKSERYIKRIP